MEPGRPSNWKKEVDALTTHKTLHVHNLISFSQQPEEVGTIIMPFCS